MMIFNTVINSFEELLKILERHISVKIRVYKIYIIHMKIQKTD